MKIIASRTSLDRDIPAIERLVMAFHQDFNAIGEDIDETAEQFFRQISIPERVELAEQIHEMLAKFPGKRQKGLKKEWFRKGAQWWPKKRDLRETLESWAKRLVNQ